MLDELVTYVLQRGWSPCSLEARCMRQDWPQPDPWVVRSNTFQEIIKEECISSEISYLREPHIWGSQAWKEEEGSTRCVCPLNSSWWTNRKILRWPSLWWQGECLSADQQDSQGLRCFSRFQWGCDHSQHVWEDPLWTSFGKVILSVSLIGPRPFWLSVISCKYGSKVMISICVCK